VTSDSTPPSGARVSAIDGMLLIRIPRGTFDMGSADSDTDATSDEKPVHTVTLDTFLMDQTEVTNAQYAKCVADGACLLPGSKASRSRDSYFDNSDYANYPVINVTWFDAQNYCKWAGRRMPTEAEWEYAARGTDGRLYPWGNDAPSSDLANFDSNEGDTTAVTNYPSGASSFGVLDMAGNVAEWTADWYDPGYYAKSPDTNPTGPSTGTVGVVRGGAWDSAPDRVRAAARDSSGPTNASDTVGFRCAQ
jgi:formylglycine-generating enzyme required for sulfatase activity